MIWIVKRYENGKWVERSAQRGPVKVTYSRRSSDARMGRFGGGWQWELGFQAGNLTRRHGTVIVNLLVSSVRISWNRKPAPSGGA